MNKQTNYEMINIGEIDSIVKREYILPDSKKVMAGKVFLNELLNLTGSEISFNVFIPGQFFPFNHKHKKYEELYMILKGNGEMEIDGNKMSIQEGSIIKVEPNATRNICNTSKETNLVFIVIQTMSKSMNTTLPTQDGIGVCERNKWV